jgi:hypothetical protein
MSELKVNTISANTEPETTVDDALIINETLEVTGVVTLSNLTPAGYVTNNASGVLDTIAAIPADDIGPGTITGLDAANIADGSVTNAMFQYLAGVTSNIQAQIAALIAGSNEAPIGSIVMWPKETSPTNWLECNGASLLRSAYPDLFAVIDVTFGVPVDGTHFYIPDLRGMFVRGWNNSKIPAIPGDPVPGSRQAGLAGHGQYSGDRVGSTQFSDNLSHAHTEQIPFTAAVLGGADPGTRAYSEPAGTAFTGLSGGVEARPGNISLMYIIKAL